ncbi:DUF6588 family protein [Solitalea koreensis]|uniref:Outer membrane protein beta-barrel domain-containing protein n=1 Tax=Solitalea koreensis TaxID=543615 RepID=A0A521DZC5_9SPHI|nr:DUF6588 family protein [Solitalea koreensis]SMO76210.1 hypothetical protein SAMN06265350_10930 [Solitalea koreensis]
MKKNYTKILFSLLIVCGSFGVSQAQQEIVNIVKAQDDASKLAQAYLSPFFKGFGIGLNNGWFQTAKTHGLFRFDITVNPSFGYVPSNDRAFDVNKLGLTFNNIKLADNTKSISPTFAGNSEDGPKMFITDDNGKELQSFNLPQGIGFHYVPTPMAQVTVGLIKGTDVSLRLIPKVNLGSDAGTVDMFGLALKHNIKQWIPGIKMLPFDMSVMAGFTNLNYSLPFNLTPDAGSQPKSEAFDAATANQHLQVKMHGFTANALISKKISVLTVYGGLGYESTKSDVGLYGKYPVTTSATFVGPVPTQAYYEIVNNPVVFSNHDIDGVKATAGFRLKLAFFTLHADGTLSKYPTVNTGIGFNFDWK